MDSFDILRLANLKHLVPSSRAACRVLLLITATSLGACGSKEQKPGQALVRVNGEEITILQINDELKRTDIQAGQQEAATKRLLESLIDRQLLTEEAMRNNIHRTPEVIQAIERAKAQIIEQAYLSSITAKIAIPSMAEVNEYFQAHPEYFAERKQFDLQQLIIPTKDINDELRLIIDSAQSLEVVASWLNSHNIRYASGQLTRNTTDLPEKLATKLKDMKAGQLFIVTEGKNSLLNFINDIKNSPVNFNNSKEQIEQYLINKKSTQAVDAEISNLRSMAKIEYLKTPEPAVR